VSKQRAKARAEREALAAQRAAAVREAQQREAAKRERQARRELAWRRGRLWRHGSGFRRNKETWAALITLPLVAVLLTYLVTSSINAVVVVLLVCVIGLPALAVSMMDRRSK
jgi:Flp pilus assembly protein TadB